MVRGSMAGKMTCPQPYTTGPWGTCTVLYWEGTVPEVVLGMDLPVLLSQLQLAIGPSSHSTVAVGGYRGYRAINPRSISQPPVASSLPT